MPIDWIDRQVQRGSTFDISEHTNCVRAIETNEDGTGSERTISYDEAIEIVKAMFSRQLLIRVGSGITVHSLDQAGQRTLDENGILPTTTLTVERIFRVDGEVRFHCTNEGSYVNLKQATMYSFVLEEINEVNWR